MMIIEANEHRIQLISEQATAAEGENTDSQIIGSTELLIIEIN